LTARFCGCTLSGVRANELKKLDRRLQQFLEETTACMGRSERRRWAGYYVRGLLLDGQRKSIEPLAQRVGADVQGLQQFVGQSPWPAEELLRALNEVARRELPPASYWIIDETSFPKQGGHSVGVARQYCGTLGKLANCQVAVSLHWSNLQMSWPTGWKLYLPQSWMEDSALRKKSGIPDSVQYHTKLQLAMELIEEAQRQNLPAGTVLADQLYGNSFEWRAALHQKKLSYCVAVDPDTGLWPQPVRIPASVHGRPALRPPRREIISLSKLATEAPKGAWQNWVWREGTKGPQKSRFHFAPLWAAARNGSATRIERWTEYALIEWPEEAPAPTKYWLCWLNDRVPKLLELVQQAKARWRVEQDYRELKDELGLDHFEGRGWMGWHHHVALVTMAYLFLRLEQNRSKKNCISHAASHSTTVDSRSDPA
jgi:SRSO17 transposase